MPRQAFAWRLVRARLLADVKSPFIEVGIDLRFIIGALSSCLGCDLEG